MTSGDRQCYWRRPQHRLPVYIKLSNRSVSILITLALTTAAAAEVVVASANVAFAAAAPFPSARATAAVPVGSEAEVVEVLLVPVSSLVFEDFLSSLLASPVVVESDDAVGTAAPPAAVSTAVEEDDEAEDEDEVPASPPFLTFVGAFRGKWRAWIPKPGAYSYVNHKAFKLFVRRHLQRELPGQ
jgi:hypothetical protein